MCRPVYVHSNGMIYCQDFNRRQLDMNPNAKLLMPRQERVLLEQIERPTITSSRMNVPGHRPMSSKHVVMRCFIKNIMHYDSCIR